MGRITLRVAAALTVALALAPTHAVAGRAAVCRRMCKEVIQSECATHLGLPKPNRTCRRDLLRTCRKEGTATCTYPNLVGSWVYRIASCTQQCPEEMPKDCDTLHDLVFVFTQFGNLVRDEARQMQGYLSTDRVSLRLDGTTVLGDTATLEGTYLASDRISPVTYKSVIHTGCTIDRLGELTR